MAEKIGWQSGIPASIARLIKLDPAGEKAYRKLERSLTLMARDYDLRQAGPTPNPDPDPGPLPNPVIAPRTYNGLPNGEPSARFCTAGLPRNARGRLYDDYSEYDDDGRDLGGRTNFQVDGLKPANEMDNRSPCDFYNGLTKWPAGSYVR